MKRVYIFYTQEQQDELVARLQKMGVLHLDEPELEDEQGLPRQAKISKDRRDIENLLIKARGVLDLFAEVDPSFGKRASGVKTMTVPLDDLSGTFQQELSSLEGKLKDLVSQRREMRDQLKAGEYFREITQVSDEMIKLLPHQSYEIVPMLCDRSDADQIVAEIEQTVGNQLSGHYALVSRELSDGRTALYISVDPGYADILRDYVEEKGFRPMALPPHVEGGFASAIEQLRENEQTIPGQLEALEKELAELSREHAGRLSVLSVGLENRLAQLDAAARFGYTGYTSLIAGWVPQDIYNNFRESLESEFEGIVIEEDETQALKDEIPVSYKHNSFSKPYQLFLDAFGTPKYGSIEPVAIISLFFPIFFGIIVGDFGYGAIVLLLALWGLAGFPGTSEGMRNFSRSGFGRSGLKIIRDGAFFSILFGLFFGEVFGVELFHEWHWHLSIWHEVGLEWPLSRVHNPITLLNFMIVVGVIQVGLGLLLGLIQGMRDRDSHVILLRIGHMISWLGFSLVVGGLIGIVSVPVLLGLAIFVVGAVIAGFGHGIVGAVEALSPFIHMLSYARLMGFALAGAVLALLINELVIGLAGSGIVGVLIGAVLAIALHAFNMLLHVFEGSIQSARLHWVEFFGKFLLEEFGGKPYEPFREKQVVVSQ